MRKCDELFHTNSCLNKAHDNEWLFILLARDQAAPNTVRFWAQERVRRGLNDNSDPKIIEALEWADRVEAMQITGLETEEAAEIERLKP